MSISNVDLHAMKKPVSINETHVEIIKSALNLGQYQRTYLGSTDFEKKNQNFGVNL